MIIDSHAHLVPPDVVARLREGAADYPSIAVEPVGDSVRLAFAGGAFTRPIAPGLFDIDGRHAWLKAQGITHQVVGPWLDMTGYEVPASEGVAWSRMLNASLWEQCSSDPALVPLATVPLQNGEAAARILKEAHETGFVGAMIGTQPKGRGGVLDDADLDPFWQAASDLNSVIVIHPMYDCGDPRAGDFGLANALGRVTDTVMTVARMLYTGHPERFSGAKIVVPIGGSALPFVLGRLMRNHALAEGKLADPFAGLKTLWFDTVVHDVATLQFVADKVGWAHIMMGSDLPFPIGDPCPCDIVNALNVGSEIKQSVLAGNAAGLFKIS